MAMPSIFLSYARQDIDTVANLAQQLRALGSTVWRDQDSLRGGQHWPQIIGEAIDTHDVFLLVWSQHAAQPHFVEWKWNTATAVSKPFLPFLLDATPLPAALRAIHAVPGHSLAAALPAIADVLQQWAHGSTTAPRISHRPAAPAGRWLTTQDRMGHEAEHAHLLRLSTQMATEPHGYIVWVTAPQGYGRHALVHSLAAQAQAEGSAVVALDFHQEALPLAPELAPYEALVRQHYPKSCGLTDAIWMACMAQLMRLVDDQTARERLVRVDDNPERGLATWLRTLTRQGRQRLVLVWEAFDAAPDFWLDLLRYLADEICLDLPVLLLPTALAAAPLAQLGESQRSQALHLAQTLMELDRATLLWLDRVTVQDVAHYLGPADPVLAERLHTLTDGLPALVESLWRQWREASPPAVVFNAGRWSVAREDDVWVFGEAHGQAYALLEACLGTEAPCPRRQVERTCGSAPLSKGWPARPKPSRKCLGWSRTT